MNQEEFSAALLDPALPVPSGLTGPDGRPPGRRFDVYRNNIAVSLTEALRQSFPVIRKLVGEDFFTALAQAHLRAHPPTSPLMMFYGAGMPLFLEAFPPVAHLGYLPDVARLELALWHSYHAADTVALNPVLLQAMGAERLMAARITLAPAVRVLRSHWPIHSIWSANVRGTPPPAATLAEDVLITRPGFDPEPHLLPAGGAAFVLSLLAGDRFEQAHARAGHADLTPMLGLLFAGGAITAIVED